LLKANKKVIALGISILILFLSLAKLPSTGNTIENADKFYHVIAYAVLTISWLIALSAKKYHILWVALCCVFFGIIIEALQLILTNYRSGDLFDILANIVGTIVAIIIFMLIFHKK